MWSTPHWRIRMTMAEPMAVRALLLGSRPAECALSIPAHLKARRGDRATEDVLQEAVRALLPEVVLRTLMQEFVLWVRYGSWQSSRNFQKTESRSYERPGSADSPPVALRACVS